MNWNHSQSSLKKLFVLLVLFLCQSPARALITGDIGNKPVIDHNWRAGCLEVANHKSRLGWWEGPPFGGGEHQFLYRGDAAALNEVMKLVGKIRAPEVEIVLHDGPMENFFLQIPRGRNEDAKNKVDARVDWTFTVWDARSFHALHNNPNSFFSAERPNFRQGVPAPRLDVYISGGLVKWADVKVPDVAGVKLIDRREAAAGVKPVGGAMIRGSVYDMLTAKPVGEATVRVSRNTKQRAWEDVASSTTNADGRFEVVKIPAGNYQVSVEAKGYAARVIGYEQLNGKDFREFNVDLAPAGKVNGVLLDEKQKPVAGAKVSPFQVMSLDGRGYTLLQRPEATTDEHGKFELTGLPAGFAYISAHLNGYHQNTFEKLRAVPDKEELVLHCVATGEIHGQVIGRNGKPKADAQVHLEDAAGAKVGTWGGSTNVDADGMFKFENVPPGKYVITCKYNPGNQKPGPDTKTIEVTPREIVEVELISR